MYLQGFGVAWFQIWETLGIWASEPVGKGYLIWIWCVASPRIV